MNTHRKYARVSNLFSKEVASVREGNAGRSRRLIDLRNTALCDRYYFHQKVKHYHYAKCVEELSNEFFISQIEITKILRNQQEYLNTLRNDPPTVKQLREKWPWMLWE